ncbi:hypothetical protein PAECIP112173_04386 [Paenibacillus sp. JJ-100]|uniref:hypothetical protein n=1 Tax=Paenibacillus sp. JJ-100 TaxID=2974896 RepID=UPI0022FF750C|nr:hypothetical protein [Paenibacillus sp. JJ-100]CAI6084731.1 hypothetical protein PAECIP112173_04386 [Paenibacillus sp. JJ-100]
MKKGLTDNAGAGKATNPKKVRNKTHKFIAVLLSAVIPGLGHIYLRLYMRGLTFILLVLLDLSALLYFSSIGIQINVPLLILLAFCIPVIYFYNVYDVLQSADWVMMRRRRVVTQSNMDKQSVERTEGERMMVWERGISFGLLLIVGGSLMVLFFRKPRWFQEIIAIYGGYSFAVLLVVGGLTLFGREFWVMLRRKKS